jgi:hypothetical protein
MQTYEQDRRCEADGCIAKLSRYNPSTTCGLHAGWVDLRGRAPYGG